MTTTSPSATEAALEGQRIGALQLRVAAICLLAQTFDGYDLSSIGMAAPALSQAWHLPGPAFASSFVMSSVGIMVGALASGPIGDRMGRKPVLIASLILLAASSFACVHVTTIPMLAALRFVTGMGIGTLMPATVALASDYLPSRVRASMIMIVFTGAPLGGFLGGQLVAQLLPVYGWTSIFVVGGVLPLLLLPVALFWLPESPRFLLKKGRLTPRARAMLIGLNIAVDQNQHEVDIATGNPVALLFRDGLAVTTVLVWTLYFSNLLSMYLIGYWLPTVLHMSGLTPADSVFAASLRDAGPLLSIFLIAPLSQRFMPQSVVAVSLAGGVVAIAVIGLANLPYLPLLATIFLVGCCTTGSMTGINGMIGALYPARVRNTGMGWALGVGRLGGIGGPWLGGLLLGMGWPPRQIFLFACVTAAIATVSVVLLRVQVRRSEPLAVPREA
ncbi:MAG TPA: MFS transporter [Rhodopila sp.]|jgi:AAHS family 4-hydroxybenzoate transporter-like MFS transporter|nr:MFS transporter [Rhodopila sp.]